MEEEVQVEEPVQEPEQAEGSGGNPTENLYKALSEKKLYTKTYDEFRQQFNTPESIGKLYDALSEKKLYTKTKDDFVNQFFPQPSGTATPTEAPVPKPEDQMVDAYLIPIKAAKEDEVFDLAKEYKTKVDEPGSDVRLDVIRKKIKSAGFNPDEAIKEFGDLPKLPGFSPSQALALKKENPYLYERKKGAIKSQYSLYNAIRAKEGDKAANTWIDNYVATQAPTNYKDQRDSMKGAMEAVHTYIDDVDEQHKVISELIHDKGYGYGVGLPGQDEAIDADPRSEMMNPYQVMAMQFLDDTDPATAASFGRLLSLSPEEIEKHKGDPSFMRGYEAKGRDLENIGMNLARRAMEEKMTTMLKNKDKWTEQDRNEYNKTLDRYTTLAKDQEGQRERYPAMAVLDADQQMQEAMGESTHGVVSRTVLGMGEQVDNAKNWFWSTIKKPFTSDNQEVADDLELLGDKRQVRNSQYVLNSERMYQDPFNQVLTGELKKDVDRIKKDESMTDDEKRDKITGLIIQNNRKNLDWAPNEKYGKANFTAKTILNAGSTVMAQIVPQLALTYGTAGIGTPGKLKDMTSLFASTFFTSYMSNYNDALEKNLPNPSSYAIAHTTIDAVTELFGDNLEVAKKAFAGKAVGEILENVSRKELSGAAKKGYFTAMKDALIETGKRSVKPAAMEGAEEFTGAIMGNALDKAVFNQDVNVTDDAGQSFITTAIGTLPLGLLGLPANYRNINRAQQYAIYEAGASPEKFQTKIQADLQAGRINQEEADKRTKVVQIAAAAIQAMPKARADGSPLTDNEKAKYVANSMVLEDMKEAETGASKKVKEDLAMQQQIIEAEQQAIVTPPEPKLDREKVEEDRKQDLKDAQETFKGKPEFLKKVKDIINATHDARITEVEKQEAEAEKKEAEKVEKKEKKDVKEQAQRIAVSGGISLETGKAFDRLDELDKEEADEDTERERMDITGSLSDEGRKVIDNYPAIEKQLKEQDLLTDDYRFGSKKFTSGEFKAMLADSGLRRLEKAGIVNLNTATNAVQEQSAAGVHVHPSSGGSEKVGEGNEAEGSVDEKAATEKEVTTPIETEEDLIKELENVKNITTPVQPVQSGAESTGVQSEDTGTGVQGAVAGTVTGDNEGLSPGGSEGAVNDEQRAAGQPVKTKDVLDKVVTPTTPVSEMQPHQYLEKASKVLSALFPNIQVTSHEKEADYTEKEQRPAGSAGVFDPVNNRIAFNMERIQKANAGNTIFHEAIHPIVNEVIAKHKDKLDDLYSELVGFRDVPGMQAVWDHENNYLGRGPAIQKAEAITEFLTQIADGKIDTANIEPSVLGKLIDFINKLFETLGSKIKINNAADLKNLSDAVKAAFNEGNTEPVAGLLNKQSAPQGQSMDAIKQTNQEKAIRKIIARSKSLTEGSLLKTIVNATGLDDKLVKQWIDEDRQIPPPPTPPKTASQLSDDERRLYYNQFKKMLQVEKPVKPNWFRQKFESLRNASAQWDNPYRYVTKITEDINKKYNLENDDVIPLGRVFEKSAAGKSAVAVQAFSGAVVDGNINGERLGKLKGEKLEDFQIYMAANRVIDRHATMEKKRLAGEEVDRSTGNLSPTAAEATLLELEKKYGKDGMDDFTKRGQAFQDHMDLMMQNLVMTGVLSQESYNKIKQDNDFYAPFSVVQTVFPQGENKGPGIAGIVKRIKGIGYDIPGHGSGGPLAVLTPLAQAVNEKKISPEEYFESALSVLSDARDKGLLDEEQYEKEIAKLENPGFSINNMIDAAASMIYRAEGVALKNTMMQRLYAYKQKDTEGVFIQDTDYQTLVKTPNGDRMVTKPLNTIRVAEGMAPVKVKLDGKDVVVAVNKYAADKINGLNNYELPKWMRVANFLNRVFRFVVITSSTGFQIANMMIDTTRTAMLSRYGLLAGKGLVEPIVNAIAYVPQLIESIVHSAAGNLGAKNSVYDEWMKSESYSKGMYDDLFSKQGNVKALTATTSKKILDGFLKLKFIELPGQILEQAHKIQVYQRGLSVEGLDSHLSSTKAAEGARDMLRSLFNQHIQPNMSQQDLSDAMDRLNYEVQNYAGSPNFQQSAPWLKVASVFLQFFSARVKGEMTDYRRVANIFAGRGEGVRLSKQETIQMATQFASISAVIAAYAIRNLGTDDDEEEFDTVQPYYQDNYLNIPAGTFEYTDDKGVTSTHRDYIKIPMRGLTATINTVANNFVRFGRHKDKKSLKNAGIAVAANASPLNLSGKDQHEYGESAVSNLTPLFKYFMEYSFDRDTHAHRDIISKYKKPGYPSQYDQAQAEEGDPWEIANPKTPEWCRTMSKYLHDKLGIYCTAATLEHMERTMGNPTKAYTKALDERFVRSKARYPVANSTPAAKDDK